MISVEFEGVQYRFFNHIYAVSRCGKVLKKLAPYTPKARADGYLAIGSKVLLHRAVAQCWLDNFDPSKHVHHINHDKTDNRVDNLEPVVHSEHIQKYHRNANVGRITSAETKEKLRQAQLGRITSEETKQKQRLALLGRKRPFFNRAPHTQEWKDQMSLNHHKNTGCRVFGVEYRSFAEANRATGIHRFTIRKRCLSKNFPEYELIPPV
jgi:hypothetical protein